MSENQKEVELNIALMAERKRREFLMSVAATPDAIPGILNEVEEVLLKMKDNDVLKLSSCIQCNSPLGLIGFESEDEYCAFCGDIASEPPEREEDIEESVPDSIEIDDARYEGYHVDE